MQLVGGGVERRQGQRQTGFRPLPGTIVTPARFAQRAPEQQRQDPKLGQVRAFAGDENHRMNGLIRELREEPAHDWLDDAR